MTNSETTSFSGAIKLILRVLTCLLFMSISMLFVANYMEPVPVNPRSSVAVAAACDLSVTPMKRQHVTVTVYHSDPNQCWGDHTITADGSHIVADSIESARWCALSRNLLSRWGGDINYGDTIWINKPKEISGAWVVHDCMNARYTNYVDLLVPADGVYGLWSSTIKYKTK